ncbi:MAG TPA: GIY-YIG nuclease family protein, partial [Gemmatales bacterium]|nr:GIY-YIG nuclease family protein [Gemmatales bacterium]
GSSPNLPAILNRMRSQLEMNGHPNRQLQQDWNSLGVGAFSFEILDELKYPDTEGYDPTKDLKELLALWMEKLQPFGKRGYHSERA